MSRAYPQSDGSFLVHEDGVWRNVSGGSIEGQQIALDLEAQHLTQKRLHLQSRVDRLRSKHAALCMKKRRLEKKLEEAEKAYEAART